MPDKQCKICSAPASCVGFFYPWNRPSNIAEDEDVFFCEEHCEHDCCKYVNDVADTYSR